MKQNIIIFDVDNTLIRGNLTFFFLKRLIKEKFYFFRTCFVLLIQGAYLIFIELPRTTSVLVRNRRDISRLDREIRQAIRGFYQKLFETLGALDLLGYKLRKKASDLLTQNFFENHLYPEGFEQIKHHLKQPNTIVVLLSGSVQELLELFFKNLCDQLDKEGIDWRERFFIQGTVLRKNSPVKPCVGSEKNRRLHALLTREGHSDYTIQFIYSDNNFMADLPLLLEAKQGGALIGSKSDLYQNLPKKLLKMFIFLPNWQKI